MSTKWLWITVLVIGTVAVLGQSSSWLTGSMDDRFNTLANIQPGLGTVMIEYGNRIGNVYHAAQAGNWGMAAYQLKEALEIQEVGETTRPARAPLLQNFEQVALVPLGKDIVNQDLDSFNSHFDKMVTSCNGCHTALGFPYIVYKVPDQAAAPTQMDVGLTFSKADLQSLLADLLK